MPLFLDNHDQAASITAADAVDALEQGVRQLSRGDALRRPRIDNLIPTAVPDTFFSFSSMEGGIRDPGYYALRIKPDILSWPQVASGQRRVTYCCEPGLYGGLVFLFSVHNAELLAIMNDGHIQHMRVGASAALGVKYLSRPDARVLGIVGSGGMARSFAETFSSVRVLDEIRVFSSTRANLEAFERDVSTRVSCKVVLVDSAREAVHGADIVATCTNSMQPVIEADWLKRGTHIANVLSWELGRDICARVNTVGLLVRRQPPLVAGFVDDDFAVRFNVMSYAAGQPHERALIPGSSLQLHGIRSGDDRFPNAQYVECVNWKSGEPYRRNDPDEITTLANVSYGTLEGEIGPSSGIQGVQFASVAGRIYENAQRQGLGKELPREMFLQTIPT